MTKAYYNEFDPYAAAWLKNLIVAGHIAPGDVDQKSIEDVKPSDLAGYTQCHFFAGIGVWSYALRNAGWEDRRNVWTGSCPCQPFSSAGKGNGFSDERHLWPAWFHLISQCQPDVIFGEQVASADGLNWLDVVQADLEAAGYTGGSVDLCAAGVGAPHIRQRLWIVADTASNRWERKGESATIQTGRESGLIERGIISGRPEGRRISDIQQAALRSVGIMGHSNHKGLERLGGGYQTEGRQSGEIRSITTASEFDGMADSNGEQHNGSGKFGTRWGLEHSDSGATFEQPSASPTNGYWRNADWLLCRDGKWRPVESGTFPLANGAPARVGRLRAYGNAINAKAAEVVIRAYMECRP